MQRFRGELSYNVPAVPDVETRLLAQLLPFLLLLYTVKALNPRFQATAFAKDVTFSLFQCWELACYLLNLKPNTLACT